MFFIHSRVQISINHLGWVPFSYPHNQSQCLTSIAHGSFYTNYGRSPEVNDIHDHQWRMQDFLKEGSGTLLHTKCARNFWSPTYFRSFWSCHICQSISKFLLRHAMVNHNTESVILYGQTMVWLHCVYRERYIRRMCEPWQETVGRAINQAPDFLFQGPFRPSRPHPQYNSDGIREPQ